MNSFLASFPAVPTSALMLGSLIYGLYNIWRLTRRPPNPPRLCNTLRYLLGYWVGSSLYITGWIILPLVLFLLISLTHFFPAILENQMLNTILVKLLD